MCILTFFSKGDAVDLLEISHLTVRMGNTVVLDDLSLSLKARQSYVLFGPNGSGKTTIINAIMAFCLLGTYRERFYLMEKTLLEKVWMNDPRWVCLWVFRIRSRLQESN